ncbi:MAG TPA: thiamine phosphate synthase [Puia sp.]|nr:thiamine phosphate synthase [Puia sp.]
MQDDAFLLAVITAPGSVPCEAELLEELLAAGLRRLHLRKPGGSVEELLERLAPQWGPGLVVHGSEALARKYGASQVHGPAIGGAIDGGAGGAVGGVEAGRIKRSTSVHSWEEFKRLPSGLEYAFISPVFDSISKPGYRAVKGLMELPAGPLPCLPVGLGGIDEFNIGRLLEGGWKGAAVLGWIWEEPRKAVRRLEQLNKIIDGQAKCAGDCRV